MNVISSISLKYGKNVLRIYRIREQNGLTLICWTQGRCAAWLSFKCSVFFSYQYYKLCMHVCILEVHNFFWINLWSYCKEG